MQHTFPLICSRHPRFAIFAYSFNLKINSRSWRPSFDMHTTRFFLHCRMTPKRAFSPLSSLLLLVYPCSPLPIFISSHASPNLPTSTFLLLLQFILPLPPLFNSITFFFFLFCSSSFFCSFSPLFQTNTHQTKL